MWWLLAGVAWAGTPFLGVEWRPLSRQDLVFVEEGRTSGTAVGALDGTVRPVVSAFAGGWINRWVGLSVGVGLAQILSTTRSEELVTQRRLGVLRPSLDVRLGWMEQRLHRPVPWFVVGGWGDIPIARDVSNGYTADERDAAQNATKEDRYRLGGGGARLGVGVDYRLLPGLMIGAQVTAGLQRTSFPRDADATVTLWVTTEAAFLLTFEWPPVRNPARHPNGSPTEPETAIKVTKDADDGSEGLVRQGL